MYKLFFLVIAFSLAGIVASTQAAAEKKQAQSAKKGTATKGTTAKKSTTAKKTTARSAPASSKKKHGRTTARRTPRGQRQPTPNRYREIQQALADRGYFKSEPDGVWGTESVEALKQFQEDQKLRPSGRLDPMSLISLGLGPKRDESVTAKTAEP